MSKDKQLPETIDGMTIQEINRANLLDVKEMFDEVKLDFWLIQGTFLGLYRNRDIISYDNDVDLIIRDEDRPKFLATKEKAEAMGFKFVYEPWHPVILVKHAGYLRHGVAVDVFFFDKISNRRVCRKITQITDDALETYNSVTYKGKEFRILNQPERWLRYLYNDTWRIPIKDRHADPSIFGSYEEE